MTALTAVLYHAISSNESDFERGLNVLTYPEIFESHIQYFEKHYDIVSLDDILTKKLPRRPLLITFDDFYKSVIRAAEDVLSPRKIPSLFFVNAGLLNSVELSLDNLVAFCVNRNGINAVLEVAGSPMGAAKTISDFISDIASKKSSVERVELKHKLLDAFKPTASDLASRCAILEPSDLKECVKLGVAIGNHTATHIHGRSLKPNELIVEINTAKAKLEALAGAPVRAFSIPYGSEHDLTPEILDTVRQSGHQAIFLVHSRSNYIRPAPDIWYRTSLHNEALTRLRTKLSVEPVLRSVKNWLVQ